MKFTWFRCTIDQVIVTGPGFLGCVIVTPSVANKRGDIALYDGESTNDPQIITIRTAAGTTHVTRFQPSLQTQRGLYLDIGTDVKEVLIQYSWGPE